MTQKGQPLPPFYELLISHPLVVGILGWLFSAVCLVLLFVQVIPEYRSFPDRPIRMPTLEAVREVEAGRRLWVVLPDLQWTCDTLLPGTGVVLLPLPSGRRILAELGEGRRCGAFSGPPLGVLHKTTPHRRAYLLDHAGFQAAASDEPLLSLDTNGGRDDAVIGLIVAPALALAGLCLYPLLRRERRRLLDY